MKTPLSNRKLVTYLLYAVMIVGAIVSLWGTGERVEIGVSEQYEQSTEPAVEKIDVENLETCEVFEDRLEVVRPTQKKPTSMSQTTIALSRGDSVVERLGAVGSPDATTMAREMFPDMEQPRRRHPFVLEESFNDWPKPQAADMGSVVPADLTVSRYDARRSR